MFLCQCLFKIKILQSVRNKNLFVLDYITIFITCNREVPLCSFHIYIFKLIKKNHIANFPYETAKFGKKSY